MSNFGLKFCYRIVFYSLSGIKFVKGTMGRSLVKFNRSLDKHTLNLLTSTSFFDIFTFRGQIGMQHSSSSWSNFIQPADNKLF